MKKVGGTTHEYREALATYNAATVKVTGIVASFIDIANKLKKWPTVKFARSTSTFPMEMLTDPKCPTIDLKEWPTAVQFEETLLAWHRAREKMTEAWDWLPVARQQDLTLTQESPPEVPK